jgi:CCR4-NOT transcription complex subunit 1
LGRRVEEEGTPDELLGYWCILADRSDFNLEAKLYPILERNIQFARYLATFSKNYVESIRPKNLDGSLLSIENFLVFLRLIRAAPSVVSPEEVNNLSAQANQIIVAYQQQASISGPPQNIAGQIPPRGPPPPQAARPPIASDPNQNELSSRPTGAEAEAIEELANAYFQKIYTSDITIPDVIQMLKRFKSSTEHKEQEIFRCMIHNLFDEYRFFHKYPEKELQVTGKLFGSLIQHQLVSSITLGIALRYVLEALRKDPEHYKQWNPENGWGSYEGLLNFVAEYRNACLDNPDAELRVSR